jgi:hypothetical protein
MVTWWFVPPMWAGQTVCVLASGPSMSAEIARQVQESDAHAIAVNSTVRLAPWADMLYAADPEWWAHPSNADAREFAGLRVSCSVVPACQVLMLRNTGQDGYDPDPECIRTGLNSGYQAIHIAMHARAAKIILCGFDMAGGHWHGDHPKGLRNVPLEHYARYAKKFEGLVKPAADLGIDIVNCTPGSAVTAFRMSTLEAELCAH